MLRSLHRTVVGVEDELLDDQIGTDLPIVGEGALMAQLSRARDRSMHSIVATIQAEQDQAIRAPGKGVVSISGGPGTGKTVVALHRAAFLLYSDRRRYEGGGVLVVGPSGVFMRYIERVLPSLGETAVALRSLGEVVGGVRATRHDEPAVADVKGALRMAELMRRTARQHAPGAPTSFRIYWRDETIVLDPPPAGPAASPADGAGPAQPPAPRVAKTLLDAHVAPGERRAGPRPRSRGLRRRHAVARRLRGVRPAVVAAARRDDRPRLAARARVPLPGRARAWSAARSSCCSPSRGRRGELSIEDVPLLDELRYAIGDVPQRTDDERDLDETGLLEGGVDLQELTTVAERDYAPGGLAWSAPTHRIEDDGYAHVLIDEAQDLTPMQWRMVGRRGRTASWTIVGDPAQSSWPDAAEAAALAGRGARGQGAPRVPPVHQLPQLRRDLRLRRRLRRAGRPRRRPARRRTAYGEEPAVVGPVDDLEAAVRQAVTETAGRVEGTVGIVVPVARRSEVNAWLASWPEFADDAAGARAAVDSAVTPSGEDRIVVLTGLDTKGLEFDGIVVVAPQEIEDESATGRSTLYVVLTRATQLLTTVG